MGDQINDAVGGILYYVPNEEFKRILNLNLDPVKKTIIFAAFCRINTLYMISRAGSGHIGSSFSSLDIMSWLELNELNISDIEGISVTKNLFFSSKGHDAPGLYSVWLGLGKIKFDMIHGLRRINGLPGHPDISLPSVVTNTGSLGMGVSKAKGMVHARRLQKQEGEIYVLTGDGELQEGQFWESLISAANHKMHEITVIIDHNKLQSDTLVSKVSDLGDLEKKLDSFGWHVSRCDGNNIDDFSKVITSNKKVKNKPKVIIADTIKGKGVSFMEHTSIDSDVDLYKFHSGAPTEDLYKSAAHELIDNANKLLHLYELDEVKIEQILNSRKVDVSRAQRLIPAYTKALIEQAEKNLNIVVLDADLILDTGLIPFRKIFENRFFECGIAEQDMVSQAGGMALFGLIPVVHSFSCFLSSRPSEQIYNNSTEKTKIIYVGSLAGILPAGPGHSHQAIRDISSLSSVPQLTIVEPTLEDEVGPLLDWCINTASSSSYIRIVSVPTVFPRINPEPFVLRQGWGRSLRSGKEVCFIGYGPTLISEALIAAESMQDEGYSIGVQSIPWVNYVDPNWLKMLSRSYRVVIILDNQLKIGGLFDRIAVERALYPEIDIQLKSISIDEIPRSGTNEEILMFHRLNSQALSTYIRNLTVNKVC